jgi:hypothetical protein
MFAAFRGEKNLKKGRCGCAFRVQEGRLGDEPLWPMDFEGP